MADTYVYLIHEGDWDSDAYLGGQPDGGPAGKDPAAPGVAADMDASFPEHKAFQKAVADLGARVVGGAALQNSRHGGTVTPGARDRLVEDAVYTDGPFTDTVRGDHRLLPRRDRRRGHRTPGRRARADRRPHRVAQGLPDGDVSAARDG